MAHKKAPSLARRQFLQSMAATPLLLSLPTETLALENRRVPILQGWTDEDESIVVVLGQAGWSFKSAPGSRIQIKILKSQNIANLNQTLYRLQVTGLTPTAYSQFAIYDAANRLIETRSLKGVDLEMPSPKIAVASCANYRKLKAQEGIYGQMQSQAPDMIFFIGDIVYSNSRASSVFLTPEDPGSALERYVITWNTVNHYQLEPLIPTITVWDDHDFGTNNGTSSNPYKAQMMEIFRSFYPLPEKHSRLNLGPGVSYRFRAFGIDFYMLDDRSFFVRHQTQWGDEQDAWFKNDYNASHRPAWILNGIQFFKYFFTVESLEKSAEQSLAWLQNMLRSKPKPVALFSGDVHCSQVQEIPEDYFGFKTFEITSSAIHSSSAGLAMHRKDDVNQLFYYGEENFLLIRPSLQTGLMDLDIRCAMENETLPIATRPLRVAV